MPWQTSLPTHPGLYWAYEDLDPVDADVIRVELADGILWDDETSFSPAHFSHFMPFTEQQPEPPVIVVDVDKVAWYRVVYHARFESGTIVESSFEIKSKDTDMGRVGAMAQNVAEDKAGADVEIVEIKRLGTELIKVAR